MGFLSGYKTYLIALAMLINAVVMFQEGDTSGAIELGLQALGMAGLRHGVQTNGINASPQKQLKF